MTIPTDLSNLLLYMTIIVLAFLARVTYTGLVKAIEELRNSIKEQTQVNSEILSRLAKLEGKIES